MKSKIFKSYNTPIPPFRLDVDIIPVKQNGESYIYFHDQMGYTSSNFAVPLSAQTIFSLLDGNRSVEDIIKFSSNGITREKVLEYVQFLDENALLQSEFFEDHAEQIEQDYEKSDIHHSTTAGLSYPDDATELTDFLNESFDKLETTPAVRHAKALYAPHIDPRVGLNSYVKAFSSIKDLKPKRVVILATSHYSGLYPDYYEEYPFLISSKNFKMPNGTAKADKEAIKKLKQKISEEKEHEFGLTFHDRAHRVEHSIEMHLLFLNHLWKHNFKIVPILVGSLDELFYKKDGYQGKQVQRFTNLLNESFQDEETFFLISGDLAHIGKKFGDKNPANTMFEEIRSFDTQFLEAAEKANPDQLLELMSEKYDPYRICGYPPLYSFLNAIPDLEGEILTYDIWDEEERESAVSFGSILFK